MKKLQSFLFYSLGVASFLLIGAIPTSIQDRQYQSYRDCGGLPCLAVSVESGTTTASLVATESQVSCTGTSGTLIAANANRSEVRYVNIDNIAVYVCTTSSACTTDTGVRIKEDFGFVDTGYKGEYTCITASDTATIQVRELSTP